MVAVIGGGITGLCLAYFLSLKGYNITLIEEEDELGGNCAWVNLGEFVVDNFYHVITGSDNYLLNLVRELGIEGKLFPVKTKIGFYQEGIIYPISSPLEFLFFRPILIRERIRLGALLVRSKMINNWRQLDDITAAEWLSHLCGEGLYQKLWRPIMRSKFGPVTDEIAATDMWFRINRISGMRDKKFKNGVYSMRGSLKTFFDKMEEKLKECNVRIVKGVGVKEIKVVNGCVNAVILDGHKELVCDKAIAAIPVADFIKLLPEGYEGYARDLARIKYLNNLCLILRLRERFSPYYQLNLGEDDFPFTGIIGADSLYPPQDFGGGYVLYISKYFIGESELFAMDKEELLKYYLPYLKRICSSFTENLVLDIAVTKKSNVEAIHTLNYSKMIPAHKAPIGNLYLLNTAQIYPEPTVLDASVKYAAMFVEKFL